ncbi:CLUMA_CG010212, isoform A [Clunio marinus]|uniref:CLUMA_CG010212, isoform A n=1 Tax=Clunio marinus TaxID=568069 RepID=A0A1J1I919_9DIPT|nr:CLUMA_CG010212, isoform A [Clunio marinus]
MMVECKQRMEEKKILLLLLMMLPAGTSDILIVICSCFTPWALRISFFKPHLNRRKRINKEVLRKIVNPSLATSCGIYVDICLYTLKHLCTPTTEIGSELELRKGRKQE